MWITNRRIFIQFVILVKRHTLKIDVYDSKTRIYRRKRVKLNWFSVKVSASTLVVARDSLGNRERCRGWLDIPDNDTSFSFEVSSRGRLSCSSSACNPELALAVTLDSDRIVGHLYSLEIPCPSSVTNLYFFIN